MKQRRAPIGKTPRGTWALALLCLALGWMARALSLPLARTPPVVAAAVMPASLPCREPDAPSRPQKKIGPKEGPRAPTLGADTKKLRACFTGARYGGATFSLHIATGDFGQVKRVVLVGEEFMTNEQRECVRKQVITWTFGQNVEPDLVIKVTL
jgi:hypothetical protein